MTTFIVRLRNSAKLTVEGDFLESAPPLLAVKVRVGNGSRTVAAFPVDQVSFAAEKSAHAEE